MLRRIVSSIIISLAIVSQSLAAALTVPNVAALASARPGQNDIVATLGQAAPGDGGARTYRYDRTSAAVADGITIVTGPGGVGRYLALDSEVTSETAPLITTDSNFSIQAFNGTTPKKITLEELKKTGYEVVNVKQHGAVGDNATDDSAALQNAIDSMPAQGGALFFPPGVYIVDNVAAAGSLMFDTLSKFKIVGHGATIKAKNAMVVEDGTVLLYFEQCTDFSVEGLTLDGNRANRTPTVPEEFSHSVVVADCDRFSFFNVRSNNATCDGFYLTPTNNATKATFPTNGTFLNCSADNCFRQGMSIVGGYDIEVNGGSWTNSNGANPEAGIDLEADVATVESDAVMRNISIRNASFSGNAGVGVQISDQKIEGVLVENCDITDCDDGAILLGGTTTVRGCTIHDFSAVSGNGVVNIYSATYNDNVIVQDNKFENISASVPCVYTHGAAPGGARILDNVATNVYNFVVAFGRGTTIINNRVTTNTSLASIFAIGAAGNDLHVEGNTFSGFESRAIYQEGLRNKYINNTFLNAFATDIVAAIDVVTGDCQVIGNVFVNDAPTAMPAVRAAAASRADVSGSKVSNYNADWIDLNGGTIIVNHTGTATPESNLSASIGSVFTRDDGTAGAVLYLKEADTVSDEGWFAVSPNSGIFVNVRDYGAIPDDATDDTSQLQDAIDALPASGGTLYMPPGVYDVDETVTTASMLFSGLSNFHVLANGATVKAADDMPVTSGNSIVVIGQCTDFTIQGLTIDGNRTPRTEAEEFAHNIVVLESSRFTLDSVRSINAVVDGIYISPADANEESTYCSNGVLIRCSVDNAYRQGLTLVGGYNIQVIGGSYTGTTGTAPESAIEIESSVNQPSPGVAASRNISISNAYIAGAAGPAIKIDDENHENIQITGCEITNCDGAIIVGGNAIIRKNDIHTFATATGYNGLIDIISSQYNPGVVIENNTFAEITASVPCIYTHGTSEQGAKVVNNTAVDIETFGIFFQRAMVVTGNDLTPDDAQASIYLIGASGDDGLYSGNTFRSWEVRGIYTDGDRNRIIGNSFLNVYDADVAGAAAVDVGGGSAIIDDNVFQNDGPKTVAAVRGSAGATAYVTNSTVTNYTADWVTLNGGTVIVEHTGTGTPEDALSGSIGSRFWRTDGGSGTVGYIKESAAVADEGWVAIAATGISDGDKTDITVSGSGATWTIDNDAVTYAKIQDVSATDRILGRDSSGAGVIEEITPGAVANMINVGTITTLTPDSATPSVAGLRVVDTANTVGTNYTNFTGGVEGQLLEIHVNDANTSFTDNANLALLGGVNIPANSSPFRVAFRHDGTQWKQLYLGPEGHQFSTAADGSNNLTLSNSVTDADIDINVAGTSGVIRMDVAGTDRLAIDNDSVDVTGILGINTAVIRTGTGSPEGVVTGNNGDIFIRTDGGSATSAYIKEDDGDNTTWTAFSFGGSGLPAGGSVGDLVVNTGSGTGAWSSVLSVGANGATITGGTAATSLPPLQLTQTWADGAGDVTYDAIDLNVTNTESNALSRLISLRVGGTNVFSVTRQGYITTSANGSQSNPAYRFGNDTDSGLFWASNGIGITNNNTELATINTTAAKFNYPLLSKNLVEASTVGSGTPNVLTAAESNTTLTNEGTSAKNYHTLPAASAGQIFRFRVMDTDGLRVTATGDDTIRLGGNVTAAAGFVESVNIGDWIELEAVNATQWIANWHGQWTDGTFTTNSGAYHPIGMSSATENDTSVDITGLTLINSNNTAPTTVTEFTTTEDDGQLFAYVATDADTTIANNSNIATLDGSNIVMAIGDIAFFVHNGTISRQVAPGGGSGLPAGGSVGDLIVNDAAGSGDWSSVLSVGANGATITGGTITDPATPLAITQTWNDAADTFDGIDLNVTNTASAAASRLINLRVGGTTQFNVTSAGLVTTAGVLRGPDSDATTPTYSFTTATNSGLFQTSADDVGITRLGTARITINNTDVQVNGSAARLMLHNDTSVTRDTGATWRFDDGVMLPRVVEANTAGSGAPNVLVGTESFKVLTNEGTTAANYHTLPTAVAGYQFTFVVQDIDGLRVVAASGDTIRIGNKLTAAAGFVESTVIGDTITLTAINATEWVATSVLGTWADGTFTFTLVSGT